MKKRFFIILAGFMIVICCVLFFGKGENLFEEGDFFIKTVTMEDRIYCLTEKGLFLEYNIKAEKFTKIEEDVKDFYAYDFDIFTVLFKDGTVKGLYDTEVFLPEALFFESDALRMKDNSVFYFDTWEKEWKKVESDSKKAVPNQLSAMILDEKGVPTIVEKANILPPSSSMDAASDADVEAAIKQSPLFGKNEETKDEKSAYEILTEQQEKEAEEEKKAAEKEAKEKEKKEKEKSKKKTSKATKKATSAFNKTVNSAANTIGREVGKKIVRGIFDTFFKE